MSKYSINEALEELRSSSANAEEQRKDTALTESTIGWDIMKYKYAVMYFDPAGNQWNKYFETEAEANTYADEQSKRGAYCIVAENKKAYEPY